MRKTCLGAVALVVFPISALALPVLYVGTNDTGNFWDRPTESLDMISALGPVQYDAQPFFTDTTDFYGILSEQSYDGYLHLYEDGFDPLDPFTGLIDANDDGEDGIGSSEIFDVLLFADVQYVLVTSAFSAGDVGEFVNFIADFDGDAEITLGLLADAGPGDGSPPTRVPEPATLLLLAAGLIVLPAARVVRP